MIMIPLLVALVLVTGLTFVVFGLGATHRRPPGEEVEPEQRTADAEVLAQVKSIAWDHRELDEPLADELIRYLNAREKDLNLRAVRNEAAEIAWRHRDECPDLSLIVLAVLLG